ncbi:MAG TPA: CbiX/SirB N-terminal domain-containing protein [Kofleriaceae bacterium]|nr:CbiX/SirB N-terminal domain-containing protein [Kofleriaceae bacterium]
MTTGVLLVGHGSRDPRGNAELEALVSAYRTARPALEVAHGYVELAAPALVPALRALADRAQRVIALPLFLFAAGHTKNDVPLALAELRRERPDVRFTATRALGVHPELVELAFERALPALRRARDLARTAVIVVGRGASDPDANGDFCKVVRLFGEGRGLGWVVPSFLGITRPSFDEAIELVARARPERIVVVPYLLFAGRLIDKLAAQVAAFAARTPWIATELACHLGGDPRLFAVLDERIAGVIEGDRPLPCDTCQYRRPIAGVAGDVGGIRALLWSVRHQLTHTQAAPHVHAHRPLARHVLVCANADCAERGSVALLAALRRRIKDAGRDHDIRVTRTHCMGRCGEGPTVAVYPDGIWYRGVTERDAAELVHDHLLGGRLVGRLVDHIMQ